MILLTILMLLSTSGMPPLLSVYQKILTSSGCFNLLGIPGIFSMAERMKLDRPATVNPYAPDSVSCPVTLPTIRPATTLSQQEVSWLELRSNNTLSALVEVLGRAKVEGIDVEAYLHGIANHGGILPRIGIALSGGGYRALMNGAGALAAFDNRTTNSTGPGHLGGLLQASTYLTGLSGGSWLLGSLYVQNFTTVESIIVATEGFLSQIWQFNQTIIEGQFLELAYHYSLISSCSS
jgi:lysophospholipase